MYVSLLSFLTVIVISSASSAEPNKTPFSVYTDLSGKACSVVQEDKETGSSVHKCPGAEGFELLVADDDARMSISVVTPDHRTYPLNYWEVITPSFSHLGNKAEWRVIQKPGLLRPIALIVRVIASDQSNLSAPKQISYLAVAKITPETICVVKKIGPVKQANERARQAADQAQGQPCLMDLADHR